MQIAYGDSYVPGELIERDREEIQTEIKAAEAEFRSALRTRVGHLEYRSAATFGSVADYLAREARSTDLFITGADRSVSLFGSSRHVSMGDLVMQVGRPVLIIPAATDRLKRVILGWKDTRNTAELLSMLCPCSKWPIMSSLPRLPLRRSWPRPARVNGGLCAAEHGASDDAEQLGATLPKAATRTR